MKNVIRDNIKGIEVDLDNSPISNLQSLVYLKDGIFFLADQVKEAEKKFLGKIIRPIEDREREFFPGVEFLEGQEMVGMDFTGKYNYINCIFNWFAISVINYVRVVGLIDYLKNNNLKLENIKSVSEKNKINDYCTKYAEEVVPEVKKFRDKIAAHFSATAPYGNDNFLDLELSLMPVVTTHEGFFEANGIVLIRDGVGNNQLPPWSVTKEFEKLKARYWSE